MFELRKRRFVRRSSVLLLAVSLLGSFAARPIAADELSDALNKQQSLNQQQQALEEKKNQLTFTSEQIQGQIGDIETQIAAAEKLLQQREQAYNRAQAEVSATQQELEKKEQEMSERRETLARRLKGLYENSQISYLEILLQSEDLGDFISRLEYIDILVANDQKLLAGIRAQKTEVEAQKAKLEKTRDQAAGLQREAAKTKTDLDQKKAQQQNLLSATEKQKQEAAEQSETLAKEQNKIEELIRSHSSRGEQQVKDGEWLWPLPGYYEITDPFGYRIHPITGQRSLHTGVDIAAPGGTPIRAAGAGTVIFAGWNDAYGNMIVLDHGGAYSTLYGHQSRLAVGVGTKVQAGQIIGYVGSTGWSTGNHLHFEIRIDSQAVDPLPYYR